MYIIYKYSDIRKENSPYSGTRRRQKVKKIVNLCLSTVGKLKSELAPAYLHLMTAKNHKNQLFLFSCLLKCNWLLLHFSPAWLGSHLAIPGADLVQPGPVPAGGSGRVLEEPDSERWRCGVEAEEVWGPRWEVESGGRSEIYYFPVSGWRAGLQWLQQLQPDQYCTWQHADPSLLSRPRRVIKANSFLPHQEPWRLMWHEMKSFLLVSSNPSLAPDCYLIHKRCRKVSIKLFADLVNAHSENRKML